LTIFLPYRPDGFYKTSSWPAPKQLRRVFFSCGIAAMSSAATKMVSKNAGRIFLPFRLHTILPAFAALFNFDGRPAFREAHFDILRVLSQSEKLLIAFHPCLLCSDLNA